MPKQCTCGKWYTEDAGINLCSANNHGRRDKVQFGSNYRHSTTRETDYEAYCAECDEPISFRLTTAKGSVLFHVLPHVCPVNEPEDDVDATCQGIEVSPGEFSGCNQTGGDCPACGK